jgi:hypothetical protein
MNIYTLLVESLLGRSMLNESVKFSKIVNFICCRREMRMLC